LSQCLALVQLRLPLLLLGVSHLLHRHTLRLGLVLQKLRPLAIAIFQPRDLLLVDLHGKLLVLYLLLGPLKLLLDLL
jgi:hypothetical protein